MELVAGTLTESRKEAEMKSKVVRRARYNGVGLEGLSDIPSENQYEIEIVGVKMPCDPGVVTAKVKGVEKQVHTLLLANCPDIDWENLLSIQQKEIRERTGVLVGTGTSGPRCLRPLSDCPLKTI